MENFENEPIFEEYNDRMDASSVSNRSKASGNYLNSSSLTQKTDPPKKTTNFLLPSKKRPDTFEGFNPISSPNSKTKLKPVSSNRAPTRFQRSHGEDIISSKVNGRPKNIFNESRVPVKSYDLNENDRRILALNKDNDNMIDDLMIT